VAELHVAIIGGGAAGTLLALHLCRYPNVAVTILDRNNAFGRGVAYSAQCRAHRLNVPAIKMGGWNDEDHDELLKWLSRTTGKPLDVVAAQFIQRSTYGDWLATKLHEQSRSGRVRLIDQEAVDISACHGAHLIHLASGDLIEADAAVLCTGNSTVRSMGPRSDHPRHIAKVWEPGALESIPCSDAVMIVGSGASGVDAVVELLEMGHQGKIVLLSRRGLLPQPEALSQPYPNLEPIEAPKNLRTLLSLVRRHVARAEQLGHPWQSVIDALLPRVDAIWADLPLRAREQFLRHVRPYWMAFRHRADPALLSRLESAQMKGQLERIAGRIRHIAERARGFDLDISLRGGEQKTYTTDWLLTAVGPEERLSRLDSRLVKRLIDRNWAVPGPMGLGFAVSEDGRLISNDDNDSELRLYALGLPTRGTFWEVSSVPAIRSRAMKMAQTLAALHSTTSYIH